MTEIEQLQQLILLDPEFIKLVAEANRITNSFWAADANEIFELKQKIAPDQIVEEFYSNYACTVGWAVLMCKILTKIHGDSYADIKKSIRLTDDTRAVIYKSPSPWQVKFWIVNQKRDKLLTYIQLDASFIDNNGKYKHFTAISFSLTNPAISESSTVLFEPDLLNSEMTIKLTNDEDPDVVYFTNTFKVGEFNMDKLRFCLLQAFAAIAD